MNRKLDELLKGTIIFTMVGLIAACAGIESRYAKQLPVKPGTDIQINITADIPLNKARVYSQKGQIIEKSDIDKNDVFCSVLMNSLQKQNGPKLSILPGTFRVTQVKLSNDENYAPRIFASREWVYDPPSNVNYETELRLQSAEQPEVRSLICVRQIDGYGNHYPRLADFKNTLGALVEFND
jgi:hypothetical protein